MTDTNPLSLVERVAYLIAVRHLRHGEKIPVGIGVVLTDTLARIVAGLAPDETKPFVASFAGVGNIDIVDGHLEGDYEDSVNGGGDVDV